jgi:hypothetical protein
MQNWGLDRHPYHPNKPPSFARLARNSAEKLNSPTTLEELVFLGNKPEAGTTLARSARNVRYSLFQTAFSPTMLRTVPASGFCGATLPPAEHANLVPASG